MTWWTCRSCHLASSRDTTAPWLLHLAVYCENVRGTKARVEGFTPQKGVKTDTSSIIRAELINVLVIVFVMKGILAPIIYWAQGQIREGEGGRSATCHMPRASQLLIPASAEQHRSFPYNLPSFYLICTERPTRFPQGWEHTKFRNWESESNDCLTLHLPVQLKKNTWGFTK